MLKGRQRCYALLILSQTVSWPLEVPENMKQRLLQLTPLAAALVDLIIAVMGDLCLCDATQLIYSSTGINLIAQH